MTVRPADSEESFPREVPFDSLQGLGLTQRTRGIMDVKLMGRWKAPNARSGLSGHILASFPRNSGAVVQYIQWLGEAPIYV